MTFVYIMLGLFALVILYMIIVTITTKPKKNDNAGVELTPVDKDKIAMHLSGAIQCATVSLSGEFKDEKPFIELQKYIDDTYPNLAKTAKKTIINKYSLIYFIKGSDKALKPACFLAHQDVVPAPAEGWEVPPFSGTIKDGYVYGRGAQDMKSQLIATLEAVEQLLSNGFKPKRGIYCCFGHDEEVTTKMGAPYIVKYLKENKIELEYVFDEGGAILDGSILGIDGKLAMIGTCEKGYADIKITAEEPGGHAATPGRKTAVGKLANALCKLTKNPMPPRWTTPSKEMFDALAPNMKPAFKFLFSNRKLIGGMLKHLMAIASPVTNSLFRTTFAPTMTAGSGASNVLPPSAWAIINCRIITGETAQDVLKHIQKVVGKDIKAEIISYNDPTPVSPTNSDTYRTLEKTITEAFDGMIPSPFLFIAATDARYFTEICDNVYRFTPFEFSEDDRERIHALNERCNIEGLAKATQFFIKFIENTCS